MCDACEELLETCHSFKNKCIENHENLLTSSDGNLFDVKNDSKDENIFTSDDIIIYEAEYEEDPLMKMESEEHVDDEFQLEFEDEEFFIEDTDSAKPDVKKVSRYTYNADEKLEAILFAEKTSNRQAAKRFLINESCIRKWRKKRADNIDTNPVESTIKDEANVEELSEPQEVKSEEFVKTEKSRRRSYTLKNKLDAVSYAEVVGNRKAARIFLVDESCIRKWRFNKEILLELNNEKGTKRKLRRPNLHWPLLEAELKSWVLSIMNSGVRLKPGEIKAKSLEIAKDLNVTNFKGTSSYISKFMERYNIPGRQPKSKEAKEQNLSENPLILS